MHVYALHCDTLGIGVIGVEIYKSQGLSQLKTCYFKWCGAEQSAVVQGPGVSYTFQVVIMIRFMSSSNRYLFSLFVCS